MKKIIYITLSVVTLAFSGCKNWFDINYDPNSPSAENVTSSMILPGAETALGSVLGCQLAIIGGFQAQYYAHQSGISNYLELSQFKVTASNTDNSYIELNQKAIKNATTVQEKASAENDWGTYLAATVVRAYAFQLLVDMYGETPYSEAMDATNLAPKFDDGQKVYEQVIGELNTALAKVKGTEAVATSLILPDETADAWIGFANALKLRMLTRLNMVKDVDSDIQNLITNDQFPTKDIALANCWSDASGQANPFYSEEFASWGRAKNNIVANVAIVNSLLQKDGEGTVVYEDDRLNALFETNKGGEFIGNVSGTNNSTSDAPFNSTDNWCRPKVNYDSPIVLISMAEVNFYIAEYYCKQSDATNAEKYYNQGVEASFATLGATGSSAAISQWPYNGIESIGVAKWIASAGVNNFEGYTEARRLGYPKFGSVKGSDMYDGSSINTESYVPCTLYTPYQVFAQVGDNGLSQRFPYAESAQACNTNIPAFKGYKTGIFWKK